MTFRVFFVSALLMTTLACANESSETDSDTSGETGETASPETDEEKTMRLVQEWNEGIIAVADAECQCKVAGGETTYEACIDEYEMYDPPAQRMCVMGVMQDYAGPEMIAFLECSNTRSYAYLPCYTDEICMAMGASGQELAECLGDINLTYKCESMMPEGYLDDAIEQCP